MSKIVFIFVSLNKKRNMSKINDLKSRPEASVDIITYIQGTLPDGTKTKYVELFYKLLKKAASNIVLTTEYGQYKIYNDNPFYLLIDSGVKSIWDVATLQMYVKFCDYNERNLIEKNDLSTYQTFLDVKEQVKIADEKIEEKKLEDSTLCIFEDEKWKIIRPLSYESSLKYGANTKWCTAAKSSRAQFDSYTQNGILIYCISKETKNKVACHKYISGSKEISFWDMTDKKIDSLQAGLDIKYLGIIMNELENNSVSNSSLSVKKKSGSQIQSNKHNGNISQDSPSQSEDRMQFWINHVLRKNDEDIRDGRVEDEILIEEHTEFKNPKGDLITGCTYYGSYLGDDFTPSDQEEKLSGFKKLFNYIKR